MIRDEGKMAVRIIYGLAAIFFGLAAIAVLVPPEYAAEHRGAFVWSLVMMILGLTCAFLAGLI